MRDAHPPALIVSQEAARMCVWHDELMAHTAALPARPFESAAISCDIFFHFPTDDETKCQRRTKQ